MTLTISMYDDNGELPGLVPSQRTERIQARDPEPIEMRGSVVDRFIVWYSLRVWPAVVLLCIGAAFFALAVFAAVGGWRVR